MTHRSLFRRSLAPVHRGGWGGAHESDAFARLLHGQTGTGWVCTLVKNQDTGVLRVLWARPGGMPSGVEALGPRWHVWSSVCAFSRQDRHADLAQVVPGLWAELDPPEAVDIASWRERAMLRLADFDLKPTLIVYSGRGWHAYWLFVVPQQLAGADRDALADRIVAGNDALRTALADVGSDTVSDLARVMRLPGTPNPKPGGGMARILTAGGPRYNFEEILRALDVGEVPERRRPLNVPTPSAPALPATPAVTLPRPRGRPRLPITVHDLRALPRWARDLVVGGWWRCPHYPSRSEADMAAVGAMVKAGFPDRKIVAAFEREGWFIGARFRHLRARDGETRAMEYLARTMARARGRGRTACDGGG